MFSGSGDTERLVGKLPNVRVCRKSKMAAINWKCIGNNVYLSFIHVNNKIPMALLMFSGSGYMTRLLQRPPSVWSSCELPMSFV